MLHNVFSYLKNPWFGNPFFLIYLTLLKIAERRFFFLLFYFIGTNFTFLFYYARKIIAAVPSLEIWQQLPQDIIITTFVLSLT